MADNKGGDFKSMLGQLEDSLNTYLGKKAPQLPQNWKEFMVKAAPYLSIIGVILGLLALPAILGLSALLAPLGIAGGLATGRPFLGLSFLVGIIFAIITLVLEAMAISPLFKRSIKGWRLLYYSTLLGAINNIVSVNIGGLIIGTLLSLYLLFQVKGLYK